MALFWILLWLYIPDGSPNYFSIGDFFRGFFLLFSLMAFGFALLMLTVRYKGVDIATNFIPHAGLVMWLGKHDFEYSQPNTFFHCQLDDGMAEINLLIETANNQIEIILQPNEIKTVDLGYIQQDPIFHWQNSSEQNITKQPAIKSLLKKLGKNIHIEVTIANDQLSYKLK